MSIVKRWWNIGGFIENRVSGEDPSTEEKLHDFLYSTTIHHATRRDAAQQSFAKAVKTTRGSSVKRGIANVRFPYKRKFWKTTVWKNTGIRVKEGPAILARARGLEPVLVDLPEGLCGKIFVEARLVYNRKTSRY